MADPVVMLPEPSPEDAVDVVWGVSTAKTLWGRGERKEAIVWIRRAAEAAMAASQSFRATELLMYASELEDVLDSLPPVRPQAEAGSPGPDAAASSDVPPTPVTPAPRPATPIAPAAGTVPRPPSNAPPPLTPGSKSPIVIPAAPASRPAMDLPTSPRPPAAAAATPSKAPSTRPPAAAAAPSKAPSTRPPAVALPSPLTPKPASVPPPPRAPVITQSGAAASTPPPGTKAKGTRKTAGQAGSTELDPWAEEPTSPGTFSTEVAAPRREGHVQREADGSVLVIEMRARQAPPREDEPDDDVVTSAAPLEEVLKRKGPSRATPPPLPPTSRPPTQLANLGPSSSPLSDRPPITEPGAARVPPAPQVLKPLSPGMLPTPIITSAPAPSPEPPKAAPVDAPTGRASFADIKLADISAFGDLPAEVHDLLTEVARIEELAKDEEVSGFGATLIVQGEAVVSATIVDTPAHRAPRGTLIPSRGTLADGVALRVVAGGDGARVAVWNQAVLDMALKSCPWVLDDLRPMADRLQALAGATMGPLGDLDETARAKVIDRMAIRVVRPHEIIAEQGSKLPWLAVVGTGAVELLKGDRVTGEVGTGDFVFPGVVVRDLPAPTTIRAGAAGAVLLTGDQTLARDILTGSPPLIGILGE
jgi:hypothetical protein